MTVLRLTEFQRRILDRLMKGDELSAPSTEGLGKYYWRSGERSVVSLSTIQAMRRKNMIQTVELLVTRSTSGVVTEKSVVEICKCPTCGKRTFE